MFLQFQFFDTRLPETNNKGPVEAERFQRPKKCFNSPTLPIFLLRLFAELCRDQNQIFAVLQSASAQVEFHAPHPARFGDDQRAIDARPAKQPPGLHVLSPSVADQSVSMQSHLEFDPMALEKSEPFAPDEFAITQ